MMKLVGPWFSGPTRRVGITLKLLGMPFEHVPLHAYLQRDQVRAFSPMGKVPALVLDDGRTLYDSSNIIDYLHELVGPERALLAPAGALRHDALHHIGIANAIYGKLGNLYDESLRPLAAQQDDLKALWTTQATTGLGMIEAAVGKGWLVGGALSQADIFAVIVYQTAALAVLRDVVNARAYPGLDGLAQRAMRLPAFAETV
jgi:glutathione S-transferase